MTIPADCRILITGHRGLVGSALWRYFHASGFGNVVGCSSGDLDLRDEQATATFFSDVRPQIVINAAALVGGIRANSQRPADFLSDNLRIQLNVVNAAVAADVPRLLFLGSSCVYPKFAPQPIAESALFTGPLEETNKAFAIAKIAGIEHVAAIRRQYGLSYICAMPSNLYGPGDNFDPAGSHVLPAMIRRFHEAARHGVDTVVCWGSGMPRREFLFVDDFARACHVLLDSYDEEQPINVGLGTDVSIAELAGVVADAVGYTGQIHWDRSKPDGTHRKLLDVHRITELGWTATTPLEVGVRRTYEWFVRTGGRRRR